MDTSFTHDLQNEPRRAIYPGRANHQDWIVLQKLESAPLLSLRVDEFAHFLCKDGEQPNDDTVPALRLGLITVFDSAATHRLNARVAKAQLNRSRKALSLLTKGLKRLDDVCPPMQRGLQSAFGSPVDDIKGLHELKPLAARCRQIRLAIAPHLLDLDRAIQLEDSKLPGDRKERLRILIDFLADWWISKTGKSVAPYVVANRRDGDTAIVHGRRGDFLSLAVALFAEVDHFKELEIISAVTNMHKDRSAEQKIADKSAQ